MNTGNSQLYQRMIQSTLTAKRKNDQTSRLKLVPVVPTFRAISIGVGVLKVVAAVQEIVPSPFIGEAIAFPVGTCNNDRLSVGPPAGGNKGCGCLGFRSG